ncbi:MAG: DUF58 domain-containing protein [Bacteroidetes bacterium]|nr:DUF58 domain-containing protein [Bacteroidota bacterium]
MKYDLKLFTNLELLAKQVVEGFIIGLHKSPFHGFSVEFAEHRLYNPGDPLRHIDWRVYGRTDKLFVKRFEEETNLRCCVAIDISSSMLFPMEENQLNKLQYSALATACLFQLLKRQLDAASLTLFDNSIQYWSACRSTASHYRSLTAQLEQLVDKKNGISTQTNVAQAIHLIAEQIHKRSLVVIFSDMVESGNEMEELFSALQHLRYNKHEVILFHMLEGEKEQNFQFENRPYEFIDLETEERIKLQPHQIKEQYISEMKSFLKSFESRCHQYNIDRVVVDLHSPVEEVLRAFLLKRNKLL